jgi:hypothetical protein
MKRNYNNKAEKKGANDSMEAMGRRYSQSGVKTYRDFIKLNLNCH